MYQILVKVGLPRVLTDTLYYCLPDLGEGWGPYWYDRVHPTVLTDTLYYCLPDLGEVWDPYWYYRVHPRVLTYTLYYCLPDLGEGWAPAVLDADEIEFLTQNQIKFSDNKSYRVDGESTQRPPALLITDTQNYYVAQSTKKSYGWGPSSKF